MTQELDLPSEARGAMDVDLLAGAAHALGRGPQQGLAQVAAQAAPTPVWRRKDLLPYFLIALVPLLMLAYDLNMRYETYVLKQRLEALDSEFDRKMKVKAAQGQLQLAGKKQEEQIHGLRQQHAQVLKQATGLRQLITRQTLIPGLLSDLSKAMSDDVVVGEFSQSLERRYSFYLSGWAASSTAAQLLINSLEKILGAWDLSVESSRIGANSGGSGLPRGYAFEVWLTWRPADAGKGLAQ